MRELKKINNRINKRKNKSNFNVKEKEQGSLYKVVTSIMTVYVLFMSFAIYAKKDENASVFNNIFNTEINFKSFNKTLNKLIDLRVIDNSSEQLHDQVVSSDVVYVGVGGDYYISDGNLVIALDDGVVTYVNGKDDSYTIIVEYDSGFRATYNDVLEVNVFVNDRVYRDDIIGGYSEKVEIIFIKDSEKITYEEVMGII